MKTAKKLLKDIFARAAKSRADRIKRAGKHKCKKVLGGTVRRVTGRDNKILKRPVILQRFYECKFCGRDMK